MLAEREGIIREQSSTIRELELRLGLPPSPCPSPSPSAQPAALTETSPPNDLPGMSPPNYY
jgi:hypothetical protein